VVFDFTAASDAARVWRINSPVPWYESPPGFYV
jgi:hypothetical protein